MGNCRGKSDAGERWERSARPCPVPAATRDQDDTVAHAIRINYR